MVRNVLMFNRCFILATISLFLTTLACGEESGSPLDGNGRIVSFQRDIAPILVSRCLECHGPEEAKNDFRVDDFETVMQYVEAEDVESSSMYTDYLVTESEDELMPPRAKGGPLSASELALIRLWIQEGADWPEDSVVAKGDAVAAVTEPSSEAAPPQTLMERIWAFQGFFHPATVHFPIALLLFGAFFVVLGWKWPAMGTQIPLACLLLGAPAAIIASLMGWSFATEQGYPGWAAIDFDKEWFWHRWSGVIVAVLSTVFAVIALISLRKEQSRLTGVWKGGLLVLAIMVGAVGHQGGELSYGADFYPKAFRILLGTTEDPSVTETTDTDVATADGGSPQNVKLGELSKN